VNGATPALHENESNANGATLHDAIVPVGSLDDPLQAFLATRCELHPRAWCRSAELWQAYTRWAEEHQERYPCSRGAFLVQLKRHGFQADRTRRARIWRGIALVNVNGDGG